MMGCSGDKQPARWALVCPSHTPNTHTSPDQWSLRMLHLALRGRVVRPTAEMERQRWKS